LLGFGEAEIPSRQALRKVGEVIRTAEERRVGPAVGGGAGERGR
jgi:hypothetical protein